MTKYFITFPLLVGFASICLAIDLTDIPNDSAFPYAKDIINSNNVIVKTALNNPTVTNLNAKGNVGIAGTLVVTGAVTATSTIIGTSNVSSYTYNTVVSTNKSTYLYIWQSGTDAPRTGAPTTMTNTYFVPFIAMPQLFIRQREIGVTNNFTIVEATGSFTIVSSDVATWKTNYHWAAYGRIN